MFRLSAGDKSAIQYYKAAGEADPKLADLIRRVRRTGRGRYTVGSSDGKTDYRIDLNESEQWPNGFCSCPDWLYRGAEKGERCKHQRVALFLYGGADSESDAERERRERRELMERLEPLGGPILLNGVRHLGPGDRARLPFKFFVRSFRDRQTNEIVYFGWAVSKSVSDESSRDRISYTGEWRYMWDFEARGRTRLDTFDKIQTAVYAFADDWLKHNLEPQTWQGEPLRDSERIIYMIRLPQPLNAIKMLIEASVEAGVDYDGARVLSDEGGLMIVGTPKGARNA